MAEPQIWPGGGMLVRASRYYGLLKSKVPNIDQLLQSHGAVIAGGYVLRVLIGESTAVYRQSRQDIDIYVPCKSYKTIKTPIAAATSDRYSNKFKASDYCHSFLRKNGIRTVLQVDIRRAQYGDIELSVDLMAVRNRRSVLDVVQNFDLTFCQAWYDGKDVWTTHPEHIQSKHGQLQGDYVQSYVMGNYFLQGRINKYISRGFSIDIKNIEITVKSEKERDIIRKETGRPNEYLCNKDLEPLNGIPKEVVWARKYIFRTAVGTADKYIEVLEKNSYGSRGGEVFDEEDGYDSDDYAFDPQLIMTDFYEIATVSKEFNKKLSDVHDALRDVEHLPESYITAFKSEVDALGFNVETYYNTDENNNNDNNSNASGGAIMRRKRRRSYRKRK
jgi:hypothetical protein